MPIDTPTPHPLTEPYALHDVRLTNRFVMAPMTRSRATQPGDVPNTLMAEYYAQRASAGLIITEATQVSLQGKGYANTPGIYTAEQTAGWKGVTDAVHAAGSKMFLQLWHVGRVSSTQVNGLQPIAPSAIPAKDTKVYIFDGAPHGDATMIPTDAPRAMTQADIDQAVDEFAQGAANAIAAGMDGVEIHGANGYLIDQFLRGNANHRDDGYGGSIERRTRFLLEVAEAVVAQVGGHRTGIRLSPFITFKDMGDPEILDTIMLAAEKLNALGVAYIHLCEADWDDAPQVPESFRRQLRSVFKQAIIVTGNYTPGRAAEVLSKGYADLVGFGRKFLTNPDYPARVAVDAPLNEISDTHTLFGGGGGSRLHRLPHPARNLARLKEHPMKAIGLKHYLPIDNPEALINFETDRPTPSGRDLLVAIHAVAVNPVDTKVRAPKGDDKAEDPPRILGWDASGIVEAVGPDATLFKPGDAVYYAGDITRPGSNAQFQLVDERIVGPKPASLSHAQAAALPLTAITAYEAFFDRLGIDRDGGNAGDSLLIIGGAGGVGSIGIQLAKIAGLRVIATASRPESIDWVKSLGADDVINHREPLRPQVDALGLKFVDHLALFNDTDGHWPAATDLIRPQGTIVSIVENEKPLAMDQMKLKAAAFAWEFMFARSMFQTPDMIEQHNLLAWIATQIDAGKIQTTLSQVLSPINAKNLRRAHAELEAGSATGKIVLEGF